MEVISEATISQVQYCTTELGSQYVIALALGHKGGKLHPLAWHGDHWVYRGEDCASHAIPQTKGTYIIVSSGSTANIASALNSA